MAYIFKNNKELNNYVCEIENLRIISWINYNYYDDGDVYSISDKDELTLDIMEALVDAGFLSRKLDVDKMREANNKRQEQLNKELERITTAK